MRIINRAHLPWFVFVVAATLFAAWLYFGNFGSTPSAFRLPAFLTQTPSGHHSVGGTPLGLTFGATAFGIFIFAGLLGIRKKVVLWRLGTLQRWMRAHIWLTLLTIPLVLFHSGFRMGGPMTTVLWFLYAIAMVSGIYGLALQHQLPRIMKERLPAETVYEQIPHIRAQLAAAAKKMRDSFAPAPPKKMDAGAPAPNASKSVTTGSTPMASTAAELSTPTARAKTATGSTIAAETVAASVDRAPATSTSVPPPAAATPPSIVPGSTTTATVATPATATPPATVAPVAPPAPAAPEHDVDSETVLVAFLDEQVLPYLSARRGDRLRLGKNRYSEDFFRLVKLRVAEVYRGRVDEIQAWCDERRTLDLQLRLQHWLHGWLFVHVPVSYFLILFTAWHAYVTLFYY
ncbi:MAG: hypothetical protein ABI925_03895 [Verrucomicrobiota bacterium]